MIHQIGGFIQNTLKPLIEELDKILSKCKSLKLTKDNVEELTRILFTYSITQALIYCVTYLLLGVMFCITVYTILQ